MSASEGPQYLVVRQQLWGHYHTDGTWHDGVDYVPHGDPSTDRAALFAAAVDELGHDDFNVATVVDGRVVAFGYDVEDFGPDEDGAPHNGHDLDEIAQACGLGPAR